MRIIKIYVDMINFVVLLVLRGWMSIMNDVVIFYIFVDEMYIFVVFFCYKLLRIFGSIL